MNSFWGRLWILIQTHLSRIKSAFSLACSFFYSSVPLGSPQKPSLLRCACLQSALAPTESLDGTILVALSISSGERTVWGLLKPSFNASIEGQGISWLPVVFLSPRIVRTPRGPSWFNSLEPWNFTSSESYFYLTILTNLRTVAVQS